MVRLNNSFTLKKIRALAKRPKFENKTFIELVRKNARLNPDHIIVNALDRSLSYCELDTLSDSLATYLISVGVQKNDRIGLCSSLSSYFIVCFLGILKAGAVYFPLDPMYPKERLSYMLEDGRPTLILSENKYTDLFHNFDIKVVKLEEKLFSLIPDIQCLANVKISMQTLAYIVYTSGSTGNPKGIMINHSSLANVATAHKKYYPKGMRMLISGGVCFDASLLVMLHALANVESIYLFDHNANQPIDRLLKYIESNDINYIISVPSQYLKILQKNTIIPSLKCVSLTGESLFKSLCHLHAEFAPNALLYNEYGPTECAIGTTLSKIYDPINRVLEEVTVGKPLPNTKVYILDNNLKKSTKGLKGEIYISGIGLAEGYWNNENLTHEKFISARVQGKSETKLYKTGDLGRFLPNGNLEFLGRVENNALIADNQINLGEIEYHIARCPIIQECAVIIQNISMGTKQLVAYITSKKKKSAKEELGLYLKDKLPKYVSFSVVLINNFPLSPNGKIDRDKLISLHGK